MTAFCIGLFRFALNQPMPILIVPGLDPHLGPRDGFANNLALGFSTVLGSASPVAPIPSPSNLALCFIGCLSAR